MKTIAETTFTFVKGNENQTDVKITIGEPYQNDDLTWSCSAQMEGLYPPLSPMISDDSFHSLCLGVMFIRNLCRHFTNDGGRILFPGTSDDVPLEDAYFTPKTM